MWKLVSYYVEMVSYSSYFRKTLGIKLMEDRIDGGPTDGRTKLMEDQIDGGPN